MTFKTQPHRYTIGLAPTSHTPLAHSAAHATSHFLLEGSHSRPSPQMFGGMSVEEATQHPSHEQPMRAV